MPSVGSDLDRAPAFIGEIEIDVALMLGKANVDCPIGELVEEAFERRLSELPSSDSAGSFCRHQNAKIERVHGDRDLNPFAAPGDD